MYKITHFIILLLVSTLSFASENSNRQKDAELKLFSKVLETVRASYVDVPSDIQLQ